MVRFDTSPRVAFSYSWAQHLADKNNEGDNMNKRPCKPPSSLITASAVILLLTACGSGGGGGDSSSSTSTNNIAPVTFTGGTNRGILNGVALGYGTKLNENIVKTVPVSPSVIGNFFIGPAYLSRHSTGGFSWIIPVTNSFAGPPRCGIQMSIGFKDSSGALLFSENDFVTGSTSIDSGLPWCLAAGEKGYIIGISLAVNADTANQVSVSSVDEGYAPTGMPTITWVPLRYDIVSANSFMVTIQNTSSVLAGTGSLHKYILLDSTGKPLGWGFLDNSASSVVPGGTAILTENGYSYDGLATSMEIFITR